MKRFGVLLASAALGATLAAPALAFGGGHGGGFGGGGFHGGGFGGGHIGGGFGGGHFGGFAGRSMATGGFNRGFGFHRGFGHRFARFDHFHHFRNRFFRNRFGFFPGFVGGWDYGFADCGYWDNWSNPYCGYGYPNYASGYGYPDSAYSYPDYDYGYPATGSSGYYASAPLVTGRSVATGPGSYCTISVKACELHHGGACTCRVPGGRAPGVVAR